MLPAEAKRSELHKKETKINKTPGQAWNRMIKTSTVDTDKLA